MPTVDTRPLATPAFFLLGLGILVIGSGIIMRVIRRILEVRVTQQVMNKASVSIPKHPND